MPRALLKTDVKTIEEGLERLGNRFRGLWKSVVINNDGTVKSGWSCTFIYKGDYGEVDYQPTALDAMRKAVHIVQLYDEEGGKDA